MTAGTRMRAAALFVIAAALHASPLAAQQAGGARLDATVGLSHVRGGTIDFRTGLLADVLAAFPLRSTSRGVVVAGLGASGIVGGMGDRCLLLPGGGCAGQGNFRVLTALAGLDHALGRGSVRLLAGPSYYNGADAASVGVQGRIDVASPALGAVALGLMTRATLLPNHGGAALMILAGGVGLAFR